MWLPQGGALKVENSQFTQCFSLQCYISYTAVALKVYLIIPITAPQSFNLHD